MAGELSHVPAVRVQDSSLYLDHMTDGADAIKGKLPPAEREVVRRRTAE